MGFALGTFDAGSGPFPGVVVEQKTVLDASHIALSTRDMCDRWSEVLPGLEQLAANADGRSIDELRVLAPIESRQIFQAGANYHKHVVELVTARRVAAGQDEAVVRPEVESQMKARAANGEPYVFLGAVSAMCGAYDDIVLPTHGTQHDWELELAVVLGPNGSILGYTIVNDITTRDLVLRADLKDIGSDWMRAKNAPTFLPTGPFIVPAHFVPDASKLQVTLCHNGEVMQDESTADMIFGVPRLLSYVQERVAVLPGDLLLTGSPAGNGAQWNRFLSEGDELEASITGLGTQRNRCTAP